MNTLRLDRSSTLSSAFALVGISMIPTAIGAFTGMSWLPELAASSPWLTFIGLLVAMFAALGLIFVTASSALGILTMNLFTFICGNLLSISIAYGLKKFTNGMELVVLAALGTAATTAGATMYALTTKRNYLGMGGTLFAVLIGVIAIGILNMFLQLPILHVLLSAVVVVLFTLYIIYDVQNIVAGGETNYILAATNLYLNILNIFTALLDLLFAFLGDD